MKNKKGIEFPEYPKLVKVGDKKVRVMNKEEEAALSPKKEEKKTSSWGDQS